MNCQSNNAAYVRINTPSVKELWVRGLGNGGL